MKKIFLASWNLFLMAFFGAALGVIGGMIIGALIWVLGYFMMQLSDVIQHITNNSFSYPHLRDLMQLGMLLGALVGAIFGSIFGVKKSDKF